MGYRYFKKNIPSGKRVQKTNWKDPPFFMGKSTISIRPFSMATLVDQKVTIHLHGIIHDPIEAPQIRDSKTHRSLKQDSEKPGIS
jgi:hypothetical protein